ncbi:hypothetical protein CH341_31730, partial [Rhodoplanes roseus]
MKLASFDPRLRRDRIEAVPGHRVPTRIEIMSHTSRVLSLAFAGALAAALASPAAALSNDPSEPSAARLDPIVQAQAPSVPDAPPAPSAGTPSASEPAA